MSPTAQAECDRIVADVVLTAARKVRDAAPLCEFLEDQAAHWGTESRRRAAMPFAAEIAAFLDERAAEIFGAVVMGE